MYNPYFLDQHRLHRQELLDEINQDRAARTARRDRQAGRTLAGHLVDIEGRHSCSPACQS